MSQLKPMIVVLLMLTSALAGCTGNDSTNHEQEINDLQKMNENLLEIIQEQNSDYVDLQLILHERNKIISTMQVSSSFHNENISQLESIISTLDAQKTLLSSNLNESDSTNDDLFSFIETLNNTISKINISSCKNHCNKFVNFIK